MKRARCSCSVCRRTDHCFSPSGPSVPVTVTLSPPSPKEIFSNNIAKLECVITGQDQSTVSQTHIIWKIDGKTVDGTAEHSRSENSHHSKVSTLIRSRAEWERSSKVSCSADKQGMTPVVQELTVHKGGKLSVNLLTNMSDSNRKHQ